jgi:hypothetical protein
MFPQFPNLFGQPEPATPEPEVQQDPEIALDAPLDSKVFLRSVVDHRNPVVGEQVTLTVFVYQRMGMVEYTDAHEPSRSWIPTITTVRPTTLITAKAVGVGWRGSR